MDFGSGSDNSMPNNDAGPSKPTSGYDDPMPQDGAASAGEDISFEDMPRGQISPSVMPRDGAVSLEEKDDTKFLSDDYTPIKLFQFEFEIPSVKSIYRVLNSYITRNAGYTQPGSSRFSRDSFSGRDSSRRDNIYGGSSRMRFQ